VGSALLLLPTPAHADAGIPMLPVAYPIILWFLVPVIGIETLYLCIRLKTDWWNTLIATSGANLLTMLIGYPLAWLACLLLEMVLAFTLFKVGAANHLDKLQSPILDFLGAVLGAAWMGPLGSARWPIYIAFVVLLIPSLLVSGKVESILLDKIGWLDYDGASTRAVWEANFLSYLFLAIAGCFLLAYEIATHK
jgi:hypothetical protein